MGGRERRFREAARAEAPGRRICHAANCHLAPGHDSYVHGLTPPVSSRAARRRNRRASTKISPTARRQL